MAQLFGVGLLWMGVHCAGMCGPLLLGLDVAGTRAGSTLAGGAVRTLLYQLGKACSYAMVGALAGSIGAGLEQVSTRAGALLALVFGAVALVHSSAWWQASARTHPGSIVQIGAPPTTTERLLVLVRPLLVSRHVLRPFFLGLVLAFLPCMISIWALGLAALTSSPLWGALVMLALAAATTPLLVLTSLVSRSARWLSPRLRSGVQRGSAALAGLWLVLMGLAALDVIDHLHLPLTLAGRSFVVMLF